MFFSLHGELKDLISTYGYGVVAGVVGIESLGIPVPGETTLVAAAIIAGTTHALDPGLVIASAAAGAIVGDSIGFWLGREIGYWLLLHWGRYVGLTTRRIKLGQYLFLRHGKKVVFFGRFVAVLRALAAFLAGANRMSWPHFLVANASGGVVWATVYGLGAYFFGKEIERLARPVGLGLLAAGIAGAVLGFFIVRRHEARLEDVAERVLPGPLQPLHLHRRRMAEPKPGKSVEPEHSSRHRRSSDAR